MPSLNELARVQTEAKHAIYAPAKDGPFLCDNCRFYEHEYCYSPDLVKVAARYHLTVARGAAHVEPQACCDYFKKG